MLSKTAEYSLRAVAILASQADGRASAADLAQQTQIPPRYLRRVLQALAEAGFVISRSGPGGGYELAKPAAKITILDVVNSVAPVERIRACPLKLPAHTRLCPLHSELDKAYAATEAAFQRVTIQQLIDSNEATMPMCDARC